MGSTRKMYRRIRPWSNFQWAKNMWKRNPVHFRNPGRRNRHEVITFVILSACHHPEHPSTVAAPFNFKPVDPEKRNDSPSTQYSKPCSPSITILNNLWSATIIEKHRKPFPTSLNHLQADVAIPHSKLCPRTQFHAVFTEQQSQQIWSLQNVPADPDGSNCFFLQNPSR